MEGGPSDGVTAECSRGMFDFLPIQGPSLLPDGLASGTNPDMGVAAAKVPTRYSNTAVGLQRLDGRGTTLKHTLLIQLYFICLIIPSICR